MIVADQKPFHEVKAFVEHHQNILVVGCGTCVTVCLSGGAAEARMLASGLRIAFQRENQPKHIEQDIVQRQCDEEFVLPLLKRVKDKNIDAVITLACGVGVNFLADRLETIPVYPGVNTTFYGAVVEPGVWAEMCVGCGDCTTHLTGGICPIARCSKRLFNGPCGGSKKGRCEVNPQTTECVWQLIYDRMKKLGRLEDLQHYIPAKNWCGAADGGVRHTVRPHLHKLRYKAS